MHFVALLISALLVLWLEACVSINSKHLFEVCLNDFSANNVPYDFLSPLFSITNFYNISFTDLFFIIIIP